MNGTIHLAVDRQGFAKIASFHSIDLADFSGTHEITVTLEQWEVDDQVCPHADWKKFVRHLLGLLDSADQLHLFEKWFMKMWNQATANAKPKPKVKKKHKKKSVKPKIRAAA